MSDPGFSGFGYTGQPSGGQAIGSDKRETPSPVADVKQAAGAGTSPNGGSATHAANGSGSDQAEEVAAELGPDEVPGFEASASECFNRARQIACSLNHADLSSDHLMLALIMDSSARRLLERVGNVTQLREVATQRVGRNYTKSDADHGSPKPTSDLGDIAKTARQAAAEREQLVSISDLVNAFPRAGDRLTYASDESERTGALIEAVQNGLVPRLSESMDKIQATVVEAMQQGQTVQKMLQDLNSKQSYETEQRQIAFMDDMRRQVRETVDAQIGVAFRQFGEALFRKLEEAAQPEPQAPDSDAVGTAEQRPPEPVQEPVVKPRTNPWAWLGLL
jgi:hypothetical protein